jgi:UDP-N-acetylglucosamine:LPS N-acetylglucosamine transferase
MGDYRFIIPGPVHDLTVQDNLILLPHQSGYFHPDLINACDAVIGKVGYSTVAEIYYAGVPFGYIARENFRESQVLVTFIEKNMAGLPLSERDFYSGEWVSMLPDLLALPRIKREVPDGAAQAAGYISNLI